MTFAPYAYPNVNPDFYLALADTLIDAAELMEGLSTNDGWRAPIDQSPASVAKSDQLVAEFADTAKYARRSAMAMNRFRNAVLRSRERIAAAREAADELEPVLIRIAAAAASGRVAAVVDDVARLAWLYARGEYPGQQYLAAHYTLIDDLDRLADALEEVMASGLQRVGSSPSPASQQRTAHMPTELPVVTYDAATRRALAACVGQLDAVVGRRAVEDLHALKAVCAGIRSERAHIELPEDDHALTMVLWGSLTQSGGPWDLTGTLEELIGTTIGQQVWDDNQYLPLGGTEYALHYRAWVNIYYGYIGAHLEQTEDDLAVLRAGEIGDDGDSIGILAGQTLARQSLDHAGQGLFLGGPTVPGAITTTLIGVLDQLVDTCRCGLSKHVRKSA